MQRFNGGLRFRRIWHFHETKPARASGLTIGNDSDFRYRAVPLEDLAHIICRGIE
jgi:hypothetical protein